jgi:hypothetical protein
MAGLIARPFVFCRLVYPSGGDFATASAATLPAGSRTVLDDHRLAEGFAELGAEHAGKHVDGAAGDEGDDDADRLIGIGLGTGGACVKREHREREREAQPFHRIASPRGVRARLVHAAQPSRSARLRSPGLRSRGREAFAAFTPPPPAPGSHPPK